MKAKINEILELFREFVTARDYKNTPVLTAYVDIDPTNPDNQRAQPAWHIELKNELKRIESELDSEEFKRWNVQQTWARTEQMMMDQLLDPKLTGRSVALFTDLTDLIAVDLPVTMKTRLYYGMPQVKHLMFALDQYKKYLVFLFSGAEVRLVEVFLTRSTNDIKVETNHELSRRFGRKAKTLAADRRDREFEDRFVRDMITEINQYFLEDNECERLIFGGNLRQAHSVINGLHHVVKDLVVAVEPIDFKLPDHEIASMIKPIAYSYEQEHDVAVVDDLVSRFHRNGTATIEKQGVETALLQSKVKTLVIPYPIDSEQFDSLIIEVMISGAEIEFVYGEGADKLNELGGIGAMLYYSGN